MRLVAKGNNVSLKLEDKMTGVLFANCPVETYPGVAIESVTDSSRYFVIRILDDNGKTSLPSNLCEKIRNFNPKIITRPLCISWNGFR